jgi:hypothetical protein
VKDEYLSYQPGIRVAYYSDYQQRQSSRWPLAARPRLRFAVREEPAATVVVGKKECRELETEKEGNDED